MRPVDGRGRASERGNRAIPLVQEQQTSRRPLPADALGGGADRNVQDSPLCRAQVVHALEARWVNQPRASPSEDGSFLTLTPRSLEGSPPETPRFDSEQDHHPPAPTGTFSAATVRRHTSVPTAPGFQIAEEAPSADAGLGTPLTPPRRRSRTQEPVPVVGGIDLSSTQEPTSDIASTRELVPLSSRSIDSTATLTPRWRIVRTGQQPPPAARQSSAPPTARVGTPPAPSAPCWHVHAQQARHVSAMQRPAVGGSWNLFKWSGQTQPPCGALHQEPVTVVVAASPLRAVNKTPPQRTDGSMARPLMVARSASATVLSQAWGGSAPSPAGAQPRARADTHDASPMGGLPARGAERVEWLPRGPGHGGAEHFEIGTPQVPDTTMGRGLGAHFAACA